MPKKKVGAYAYDKDNILGSGQYGKVYMGEEIATKTKVAVKVIDREKINEDEYTKNALLREIEIMKSLKSPNIINFLQVHETKNNIYIFQELADGGTLKDVIETEGMLDQDKAIVYMTQLVLGFGQLALNGIIHRDLKPDNILRKGDTLKLADFGFARYSQNMSFMNSIVGSPAYMAPQVLNREKHENYSYKCDIWSFGVVCFELITGNIPWVIKSNNIKELYNQVEKQSKSGIKFPSKIKVSDQLKDLIQGCLRYEQNDRFDWTQIFRHPIFKGKFGEADYLNNDFTIQEAFALTRLRMSIHAQNLDISRIFQEIPDKIDFESFCIAMKVIDPNINQRQTESIFKSITKDKEFIIKKELLNHFEMHGIKLQGMKFSNLTKMTSTTQNQIDKAIEEIGLTIEQNDIEIDALYKKYNKKGNDAMDVKQFSEMLLQISPNLSQQQILQIFNIFDPKGEKVSLKTCKSKLCKLTMTPNIGKDLRQSISTMASKKKSV